MMATRLCAIVAAIGMVLATRIDAVAQATYLGPTPYVGRGDSPFDTGTFGFCVEDFENNKFDIPGATGNGSVVAPGGITKWLYREVLHADLDDPYLGLGDLLFANYPFAAEDGN